MNTNYAKKQVKRIARNIAILSIIFAVLIGILLVTLSADIPNLYGPHTTIASSSELSTLYNSRATFVEIQAEDFFDSGYTRNKDNKDINKYYVCYFDEEYIVCKTDIKLTEDSYENYTLTGKIIKPESVDQKAINRTKEDAAESWGMTSYEAGKYFSNYMIDTTGSRILEQIICGLGYLVVAALIFLALSQFRFVAAYTTNKWYKKLSDLDPTQNADRVNEFVSREYDSGDYVLKMRQTILMRNWILLPKLTRFSVKRSSDLIWVYKTITQHRTNGIPTGKSYSITLRFKDKTTVSLTSKKKNSDALLDSIKHSYPHTFVGYTDSMEHLFRQDIDEFVRVIENAKENTSPVEGDQNYINN